MKTKIFHFLAILFALQSKFAVFPLKYEQINDCNFHDVRMKPGDDKLTFICAENGRESSIFVEATKFKCSNQVVDRKWVGEINFKDCRFRETPINFFERFLSLHKFIASDLELENLQLKMFSEAKNLTYLDVSRNRLTEIPSPLFFNTEKLKHISFENNFIERIDYMAFVGAKNLQSLNFTNNKIHQLDSRTFSTPNLLVLDLSRNNLTHLEDHIFDSVTNLKHLNLAFNPIGNLKIAIFAHLLALEDLNLKQTNITSIQLGTFSHQHNLVSLDLSDNHLKQFDFGHFLPILPELKSLYLNGNQMRDLEGFENALFPQLAVLDIKGNNFNCSYLQTFMKSVCWEKLRLPIDHSSIQPGETSIRGIKCEMLVQSELETIEKLDQISTQSKAFEKELLETVAHLNQQLDANILFIKISLACICTILVSFLILFVVINRGRLWGKLYTVTYKNQPIERAGSVETTVEFTNHSDILLVKER